jgi:predicted dehydrogenase/nucleoside-diphosphate-sugar epimerase
MHVGIVGCGRVADHHLRNIQRTRSGRIAGLVDVDAENLRRLGSKYGVSNLHSSLEELLDTTPIDVVHICTPPVDHFPLVRTAIRRGIHVFVEKPIAFQAAEVAQLYQEARERGVSLCPDFIQLFHPAMVRARSVLQSGAFGKVVHCVCNYGFSADDPALREALGLHWAYQLAGGLFRNHLTHPLYLVMFWIGESRRTVVIPRSFGTLPQGLPDHLEITLEGTAGTGHITLTTVTRPSDYHISIYCERGVATVNFRTMTVVLEPHGVLPGAIERLTSGIRQASQLSSQFVRNTFDMLTGRLIPYQGLGTLIPQYYESITTQKEPPIPERLAIAVSEAEDDVLEQTGPMDLRLAPRKLRLKDDRRRVVVTGATGFVGREVVRRLVKSGYAVRVLVRPQSQTDEMEQLGVELAYGDVRDRESLRAAFEGVSMVIHLAAGLRGSEGFILDSGIAGTANVAAAARDTGVRRVIYTSSVSVYDFTTVPEDGVITEETRLDHRPDLRGAYSKAKCKAEEIAMAELFNPQSPWTILRPAVIFGNGHAGASLVGFTLGSFLFCWGRRNRQLRLVHVSDVAQAIVTMCDDPSTAGRIFNVAHPDPLTAWQYISACLRDEEHKRLKVIYIPHWLFACAAFGLRQARRLMKRLPNISSARVVYSCRGVRVSSRRLLSQTAWRPADSLLAQLVLSNRVPNPYSSPWGAKSRELPEGAVFVAKGFEA